LGQLLAISPPIRAKFAEYIRRLDSVSTTDPICDSTPLHLPSSTAPVQKYFFSSLSSSYIGIILITWTLSSYISLTPKHLGSYGYPTDMISFLLSHATHLLMDCVLL
jgi:hypothetical protein